MLYYTSDLPFPITHSPDNFQQFRKEVERFVNVRFPLEEIPIPSFNLKKDYDSGVLPNIPSVDQCFLKGGERVALDMLDVLSEKANTEGLCFKTAKDELEHIMIYLCDGCLSPKKMFHALKEWKNIGENRRAIDFAVKALLWRDFYRLMGKKYRDLIFEPGGIKGKVDTKLTKELTLFNIWKEGRTGIPYVDACMLKLKSKGYLHSHEKKLIASFSHTME